MEALAAVPQDVNQEFGSLFNYLNRVEEFQESIIELLPFATDNQLVQTKERGLAMGSAGWRIVAACDAEQLARMRKLTAGRGRKDTEGEGKVAAVKEHSRETKKCDAQTYRNAQLVKVFGKKVLFEQNNLLDEKGYYEQALRTPEPKKTIKMFEREKKNNPTFSVGDAKRLATVIREQREAVTIPSVTDYIPPNLKDFLIELENTLNSFANRCPRPEFKFRIDGWIRATRFERGRTPQSDYEAVRRQVDNGACTSEEVMDEVYLSEKEIKDIFDKMIELEPKVYEWRPIGVNTDMARGSRSMGIFRKDAPSGDDFTSYAPRVEYGEED